LAKSLQSQKVSVTWAEKMDQKLASVLVPENDELDNGDAVHQEVQNTH